MKIKLQTDQRMELEDLGTGWLIFSVALTILGLSLATSSFFVFSTISSALQIPSFILLVLGICFFIVRTKTNVVFDKTTNKVNITHKSMLRSRTELHEISDIKGINFRFVVSEGIARAISSGSGGRSSSPMYLALALSSGRYIVIGDTIWSNPRALLQPKWKSSWRQQIGQQIATFLRVPYAEGPTEKSDYFHHVAVDE